MFVPGRLAKNGVGGEEGGSGFVSGAAYKRQFMVYYRGWGSRNFFLVGVPTLVQKGLLDFFCGKLLLTDEHVFLKL